MRLIPLIVASSSLTAGCDGFAPPAASRLPALARLVSPSDAIHAHPNGDDDDCDGSSDSAALDRRSALRLATTTTLASATMILSGGGAHAEDETMERGGVKLTPFNSLAFNYRGAYFYA